MSGSVAAPAEANRPRAAGWKEQARAQWLACQALSGRREDLEALLERRPDRAEETTLRYYLGLACARENQLEPAIRHLRAALALTPGQPLTRKLLYKLLIRQAAEKARQRDWRAVSQAVTSAVEVAPPEADPRQDLAPFRNALPIAHIRAGNRREAARVWEEQLRAEPYNPQLLRNLAVLYFWWARAVEHDGAAAGEPPWKDALAYWTVLLNLEAYWEDFRRKKEKLWKLPFPEQDLEAFRKTFLEEQLCRDFRDRAGECQQRNDPAGARHYEECLTAALLEKRSAECWQQGLQILARYQHTGCPHHGMLDLPAGYHFFERFSLLEKAGSVIAEVAEKEPKAECLPWLRIYFSSAGLGRIAVLIDERKRPDEAVSLLEALPLAVKTSAEGAYLRSRALTHHAAGLFQRGQASEAFKCWKDGFRLLKEQLSKAPGKSALKRLFEELKEEAGKRFGEAIVGEATRLQGDGKQDAAVSLLEQAVAICDDDAVKQLLCVIYCDRGSEKLNKDRYAAAREEFQKALKLDPKHPNAKAGMSTAYNNEGAKNPNLAEAQRLLEKAVEYNPGNHVAQQNLAAVRAMRQMRGY